MILNVKNGLLNLRDLARPVLMPHTPDYLFPVQIPVNYDPAAIECPEWDKQIAATFPADCVDRETAFEIVAFLISFDRSIQKAILLLGDGGTGKSTFLEADTAFLGRRNVSAMSLHKIERTASPPRRSTARSPTSARIYPRATSIPSQCSRR
jgi:phage/plasmid-associated DNA primase